MKLRHAFAGAIALTALGAMASSARAQTYDPDYPVCLQVYQSMVDFYFDCTYQTMAQCAMSASGRAAQCVVNPYYGYGKPPPARGKRQKRPSQ
jgi:hypothetical protein